MRTAEQIVSDHRHMYHTSITDSVAGKSGLITIRRDKLAELIGIAQQDAVADPKHDDVTPRARAVAAGNGKAPS